MTPAEQLAKAKTRKRPPRRAAPTRKPVWTCRVRERRESLGLSLRDVAKGAGLSITALWQLEAGHDTMLTTATRLAHFFGCRVDELWPENAKKE